MDDEKFYQEVARELQQGESPHAESAVRDEQARSARMVLSRTTRIQAVRQMVGAVFMLPAAAIFAATTLYFTFAWKTTTPLLVFGVPGLLTLWIGILSVKKARALKRVADELAR